MLGIECVYDDKRSKPGLRTGVVENLSQRLGKPPRRLHFFLGSTRNLSGEA